MSLTGGSGSIPAEAGLTASDRLAKFGAPLFACCGTGHLVDAEDALWECTFEAVQLQTGQCIVVCDLADLAAVKPLSSGPPKQLAGRLDDGRTLQAEGLSRATEINYGKNLATAILFADRIEVAAPQLSPLSSTVFGLTNLILRGWKIGISGLEVPFTLTPLPGSSHLHDQLSASRGVLVTAELTVQSSKGKSDLRQIANDVCDLLSLARGTRIQWIYMNDLAEDGSIVCSRRFSTVTKGFGVLRLIELGSDATQTYLDRCLAQFRSKRDKWQIPWLLNAYLDAKAENDYLQLRGVKLAAVVEMLKASYFYATGNPEHIIQPKVFKALTPKLKDAIKPVLQSASFEPAQRCLVYGLLEGLNRPPFRRVLEALCSEIGLTSSESDTSIFVSCRNELIHYGRFLTDPQGRKEGRLPFNDPIGEFRWLLAFVDRLLLRLVGYKGPYLDWRTAGQPPKMRELE